MSTNGMESWAVDLKDVAAVYPFQGSEFILYLVGLAFWIGWHIIQMKMEKEEIAAEVAADSSGERAKAQIDKY